MSSQISIHALLAESDVKAYRQPAYHTEFLSTLSLRRATGENKKIKVIRIFLSTLSLRRATLIFAARHPAIRVFLSTLSLRRATPGRAPLSRVIVISIHALLAESDDNVCPMFMFVTISIHALLAESDPKSFRGRRCPANFYPRSPCGERRNATGHGPDGRLFLSTLSLRRATVTGSESQKLILHFYPRSPCGERHRVGIFGNKPYHISIHALLAESDPGSKIHHPGKILFLSTLSLRRATGNGPNHRSHL